MGNSGHNLNIRASGELEPYLPQILQLIREQIDLRVPQTNMVRTIHINNGVPVVVAVNNNLVTISHQDRTDLTQFTGEFDPTNFPIDISMKLSQANASQLLGSTAGSLNISYFPFLSDFPELRMQKAWEATRVLWEPSPLVEQALRRVENSPINPAFCHMTAFIKQDLFANCKHSSGMRNLLSDDTYCGQVDEDGVPNGFGTLVRTDCSVIEGFFQHGSPSIFIREVDAEGTLREGYYKNGQFRGAGYEIDHSGRFRTDYTELNDDGSIRQAKIIDLETGKVWFEGTLKSGVKHGLVNVWFDPTSQSTFTGNFVNGLLEGFGTKIYPNGHRYQGEFVAHKENGLGTLYFSDGRLWQGTFSNGEAHGNGFLYIPESDSRKSLTYHHGQKQV